MFRKLVIIIYSIGIDSGSVATKGVLYNGKIVDSIIIPTGWSPQKAALEAKTLLLANNNLERENVGGIIGTGYGRVAMDFADKTITEITCHAKGVFYFNANIRTILDIGGQDSKVIVLNKLGKVQDFLMNDKCAAGTGRFLQVMVNRLGEDIANIDSLAQSQTPLKISNMCTVFAESEIISLLANGANKKDVAAGIIDAIAERACNMLKKVNLQGAIAFTGGVAKSILLQQAISNKLGRQVIADKQSQIMGALGAAIIAYQKLGRS